MPFDFNSLFQNPQFMAGAGMLGGPQVQQPLQLMQEMQQARINQEYKQQAMEMERARTKLYEQQNATAERNSKLAEDKNAFLMKAAQQFFPQQAQSPGLATQGAPNAPQQPQLPSSGPALPDTKAVNPLIDQEPSEQQKALMRAQSDVANLNKELAMPGQNPEQLSIKRQELEKATQRQNFLQAIPQQQADPFAQYHQGKQLAGLARMIGGDAGGLSDMADATKPNTLTPGQVIMSPGGGMMQVPDPKGDTQLKQGQAHVDIAQGHLDLERGKDVRATDEKKIKQQEQFAKDEAAYTQTTTSADRAIKVVDDVLNGALKDVTGGNSITNAVAIPGRPAKTTLNNIAELKAKLVNDTLQNIRAASKNQASGYGSFTERELEVVEKEIANLDLSSDYDTVKKKLQTVRDTMQEWKERAGKLYTGSTGKPVPNAADQPITLDEYMRRMRGQ